MRLRIARWAMVLSCAAMAAAVGGGFYEGLILGPLWSRSPPASFSVIQPGVGVPMQAFWIPVHGLITGAVVAALVASWKYRTARRWVLVGLASYVVMRGWSAVYFIPEMLQFQQVPLDAPATAELVERVRRWTTLTWWREPLDLLSLASFFLALLRLPPPPLRE